jgi:hypothetical protein
MQFTEKKIYPTIEKRFSGDLGSEKFMKNAIDNALVMASGHPRTIEQLLFKVDRAEVCPQYILDTIEANNCASMLRAVADWIERSVKTYGGDKLRSALMTEDCAELLLSANPDVSDTKARIIFEKGVLIPLDSDKPGSKKSTYPLYALISAFSKKFDICGIRGKAAVELFAESDTFQRKSIFLIHYISISFLLTLNCF